MRRLPGRLVLVALILACFAALGPGAGAAGPVRLTILHFNDAHEMDAAQGGTVGGLARVATLLTRLKRTAPPVLSTLGGDFLSPAAIGTAVIDGEPMAGRQAIAVLNMLGVQWATLGNHEFDLSESAFHARLAERRFGIVSSNVTDASGAPFAGTVTSAVVPIATGGRTIRIGLIGLTIDFNRKPWVRYLPAVDAAATQVAALRGRTDAIVALTHLGLPGDQAVAAAVPEIDLILGGHEHENWMLRRGPHFTPIMKADANGRSAVVATLTFGGAGTRPTVTGRVEMLGASVAPDPRVRAEIARWMTIGFDAFRKSGFAPEADVATIREPLDGRESTVRNRAGNLTDVILAAMLREVPGARVAILNGGSVRVDDILPAGVLTQYDVIRVLPFGGKVLGATLDGALLAQVLDAGVMNQGSGGYLQTAGVERRDGGWFIAGQPLDPRASYPVALPEFLLTGGETRMAFLTRANAGVREVVEKKDVRLALIEELKARRVP